MIRKVKKGMKEELCYNLGRWTENNFVVYVFFGGGKVLPNAMREISQQRTLIIKVAVICIDRC